MNSINRLENSCFTSYLKKKKTLKIWPIYFSPCLLLVSRTLCRCCFSNSNRRKSVLCKNATFSRYLNEKIRNGNFTILQTRRNSNTM